MLAGSPPSAMTTGMRSPAAAISRQCAAPTLWRCQCIASVSRPSTWMRYMPTLRMPRIGSRVITIGRVMYRPPSPGQVVRNGMSSRLTASSRSTTSWHGARPPRTLGGNLPTSASFGSIASFPKSPSGTFSSSSSEIRPPISSRSSTPSARHIRRIEPKRLMATGCGAAAAVLQQDVLEQQRRAAAGALHAAVGDLGHLEAGPHRMGDADQLADALDRGDELAEVIRGPWVTTFPLFASRRAVRGYPTHERARSATSRESRLLQPARQLRRPGERLGGLWKPGIGARMFRDHSADPRQHTAEIEQVQTAEPRVRGQGHLEDHQAGARLEHACRLAQSGIQVHQVPHAPADHRAVERRGRETAATGRPR